MVQWEVKVITSEEGRVVLSDNKENKIRTGWTFTDDDKEVLSGEATNNILFIAKMRGDGIVLK